jgi:hypothetical protein
MVFLQCPSSAGGGVDFDLHVTHRCTNEEVGMCIRQINWHLADECVEFEQASGEGVTANRMTKGSTLLPATIAGRKQ